MGRGGGGLPKDWLDCPKMGTGLVDQVFLVFKTPLSPQLNKHVAQELQFTLQNVFQEVGRLEKESVLWIDLTNTERYYRSSEVTLKGFTYLKLAMEGHGCAPLEKDRQKFCSAVDRFLEKHPQGVVAVHCTHGFNRTGFLISYYLMTRRGFNAHQAVTEFSRVRSPGIYRKNYVQDLYHIWKESPASKGVELPPIPEISDPQWISKGKDGRSFFSDKPGMSWRYRPNQNSCHQEINKQQPPLLESLPNPNFSDNVFVGNFDNNFQPYNGYQDYANYQNNVPNYFQWERDHPRNPYPNRDYQYQHMARQRFSSPYADNRSGYNGYGTRHNNNNNNYFYSSRNGGKNMGNASDADRDGTWRRTDTYPPVESIRGRGTWAYHR